MRSPPPLRLGGLLFISTEFVKEVTPEILKKCIKRNRKAQYTFYKCYFPYLYAIGFRYTYSKEQTMEVVNLGFAKIMLNLKKYDQKQEIKTWMKTILVNVIIDEFRKSKSYNENIQIFDSENLITLHQSSYTETIGDNLSELVQKKLGQISPITRKVFNLYAIDGYKHKEIAEMLKISEGTSFWHYSTAKKELREYLGSEMKYSV